MRILFTTTGSAGHLGPLLPFAGAVRRAGGDVLLATRASSADQARATGHDVRAFADAPAERRAGVMASLRGLPAGRGETPARPPSLFGGIDARRRDPGEPPACDAWRPGDVIVSEPSEFAGRAVGRARGVPAVTVGITQYAVEHRFEQVDGETALRPAPRRAQALWRGHGFRRALHADATRCS